MEKKSFDLFGMEWLRGRWAPPHNPQQTQLPLSRKHKRIPLLSSFTIPFFFSFCFSLELISLLVWMVVCWGGLVSFLACCRAAAAAHNQPKERNTPPPLSSTQKQRKITFLRFWLRSPRELLRQSTTNSINFHFIQLIPFVFWFGCSLREIKTVCGLKRIIMEWFEKKS